jgi:hypothetical protein
MRVRLFFSRVLGEKVVFPAFAAAGYEEPVVVQPEISQVHLEISPFVQFNSELIVV